MGETADLKIQRRFEHAIDHLIVAIVDGLPEILKALDARGAEGWECFHIQTMPSESDQLAVALVFRRQVGS